MLSLIFNKKKINVNPAVQKTIEFKLVKQENAYVKKDFMMMVKINNVVIILVHHVMVME